MMKIKRFLIFLLALFIYGLTLLILDGVLDARYLRYRQTDPMDIVTRDKIDRDIDAWIEKLDRQVQADTVLLTSGTSQVVQLSNRYADADYQIFIQARVLRGFQDQLYVAEPTTDSSFTITKNNADLSTVQWMTIYK